MHKPVLLDDMLNIVNPKDRKFYLDCTFGAGSYSKAILESANCSVVGLDRDSSVTTYAKEVQDQFPDNFSFINTNFAKAIEILSPKKFDGIVLDLGVSSMQLDSASRGFSFQKESKLDMRMESKPIQSKLESAFEVVNYMQEKDLADIIYHYGEEVQSKAIAKAIVMNRKKKIINTTIELATIIRKSMHYTRSKIDPVTKTFQAIRIYINQELKSIEDFLKSLKELMNPHARVVFVSFHSLEDRLIKHFFKKYEILPKKHLLQDKDHQDNTKWLKILTKKPIMPSYKEVQNNKRSRSARLRAAERITLLN